MNSIAQETVNALFNTQSIVINTRNPFQWTSGIKSPIYVDCRRLMSFPQERTQLMQAMGNAIDQHVGINSIDAVAGGESAGIPYAAFVSEYLNKPMIYVRKAQKEYGKKQRIEGVFSQENPYISNHKNPHIPLIEDQASNGQSKFSFVKAMRDEGIRCHDCFTLFYYDIFPEAQKDLENQELKIHSLATGQDILAYIQEHQSFNSKEREALQQFLKNPHQYQP
jgi:orotate phosphoribosyltransferase